MRSNLLSIAFALLLVSTFSAQGCETSVGVTRLPPTDESTKDAELREFLGEVQHAVASRDAGFLMGVLAPSFRHSFGPDENAPPDFSNPENPLWRDFGHALQMGGAFMGSEYCIPYAYASFPADIDPLNHQVVVKAAKAHEVASHDGRCLASLEEAIVRSDYGSTTLTTDNSGEQWAKIYLGDNPAFVPAHALRSPLGFRACFEKVERKWRIKAMMGGD